MYCIFAKIYTGSRINCSQMGQAHIPNEGQLQLSDNVAGIEVIRERVESCNQIAEILVIDRPQVAVQPPVERRISPM
jgi:hypothetical protein